MMDNFWIPKLIENGYKRASAVTGPEEMLTFECPCPVSWFFKRPFVVATTSTNGILYFILGLDCDPVEDSVLPVYPEAVVSSGVKILSNFTRIEKSEEIQRLIEATPNDLALCLDIAWAKPLIEVYFKKYASFHWVVDIKAG